MLHRLRAFVFGVARRRQSEREAAEELEFHLQEEAKLHAARGVPPHEARRVATLSLGGTTRTLQAIRDVRTLWIDALGSDVRHAGRTLLTHWLSTLLAVVCLGLAIGTSTTVFTFVNGLLLLPLPLPDSGRLMTVHEVHRQQPLALGRASWPNVSDWQSAVADVAELGVLRARRVRLTGSDATERRAAAEVSSNLFAVLGIEAARGRTFAADDSRIGAAPVALISHVLWQARYGADPAVIGRPLLVDGQGYTVIGVLPASLSHVALRNGVLGMTDVWLPLLSPGDTRGQRDLMTFARLAPGEPSDALQSRLTAVSQRLAVSHPDVNEGWGVALRPLRLGVSSTTETMLLLASGAVGCILLIACANVATLTLTRAVGRRREWATRLALGASAVRIARQVFVESVLVAGAAVPLSLVYADAGRSLLLARAPLPDIASSLPIDGRVVWFTIATALVASVAAGLLPSLWVLRRMRREPLNAGGRSDAAAPPPHGRLSSALVTGELALAVVLLVGAALFAQSFQNLLTAEGSIETASLLVAHVDVDGQPDETGEHTRRMAAVLDTLVARQDVTAAAAATVTPLRDGGTRTPVEAEGSASGLEARPDERPVVFVAGVTSNFFKVLDVPLHQGRPFSEVEGRSRSAVAIVNRAMVERIWPNESAIGRRFRRVGQPDDVWFTVIGVSANILSWDVSHRPMPTAYLPYGHHSASEPRVLLRVASTSSRVMEEVRQAIVAAEPRAVVLSVRTMTELHHLGLARSETLAALFASLGGIALLLGAAGVYGVLSSLVAQRTYELGVRATLGAEPRALIGYVLRRGLRPLGVGVTIGLAGAWALARVARAQLHEVSPSDPLSFATAALLMLCVGLMATYLPARRASKVDPLAAIRHS